LEAELEKEKEISMMTTGISEEAFATIVAQAVIEFPHMSLIIIEKNEYNQSNPGTTR